MANVNNYFTLDNVNDLIEIFEDFLERYGVRGIPESEKQKAENKDTDSSAIIYGMVYGDLQGDLLDYFERLETTGVVKNVVNSWNGEVEDWEEPTYKYELTAQGWTYFKTNKANLDDAIKEFDDVCNKAGIDNSNIEDYVLRKNNEDYEVVDSTRRAFI